KSPLTMERLLTDHSIYLRVQHQTKTEEWWLNLLMHYCHALHQTKGWRDQLRRIAVLDEAILHWADKADTISGTPLLQELATMLREWSTAVIASTTSLKLLSNLLKNNCGLYLCTHNVAELDEVR